MGSQGIVRVGCVVGVSGNEECEMRFVDLVWMMEGSMVQGIVEKLTQPCCGDGWDGWIARKVEWS